MKFPTTTIAAALLAACASNAFAAVSPEDAKKLGLTLTGVGAEKAGNKDGTIPEYTGGLTASPAGFKKGEGSRPDPYANEKPLFSIDAKNMDKHADKLTEGTKALMKKYPTYRVDVYPSHRTAAFPKYVTDNTAKCAVSAKTTNNGLGIEGCHAGYPFPIPKTGNEAMWNHLVRYSGQAYQYKYQAFNVDASGKANLSSEGLVTQDYPYWDSGKQGGDVFYRIKIGYTGPPRRAGEAVMVVEPVDYVGKGRRAWQYLPGQRRVKLAPDISFDTPSSSTGGATTYDDTFLFNGSMERYNFKLVGKKEVYVPYNNYKLAYASNPETVLKPNHLNPDFVRWELHRAWVVEATLAEGKRHIYSKRTFYLDEDSWVVLASDENDGRNQLYRSGFAYLTQSYDQPAPFADTQGHYDLISGAYTMHLWPAQTGGVRYVDKLADKEWSADTLAGSGVR
ncbi:MAG: DUF1329 domain-containing protein [Pseudomonadota bacterium]